VTRRGLAVALGTAVVLLLVWAPPAMAWSPGTHIYLGETVLANLPLLSASIAALLRAYPYDFLYGSIAADTSIAKKYAPVGRHCHAWHVGTEILDRADTDALRAFGWGYLSHLAADTVAHNFFVPRQLVVASSTIAIGHSYWESRFESHLGEHFARTAMDVVRMDHGAADAHLDRILSPTIFSVRTSRRLFRGMVGITDTQSWQAAFRVVAERSRWDLSDEEVDRQMRVTFQMVMELLAEVDTVHARNLDPAGEASLRLAKKMRVDVLRNRLPRDTWRLTHLAEERFGLPSYPLLFWEQSVSHPPWRSRLRAVGGT
jgi:Zinc dependent phospholipase C